MPSILPPLHREIKPPRLCAERGCQTWLASANEDQVCALHGGWRIQLHDKECREDRAEVLQEVMSIT